MNTILVNDGTEYNISDSKIGELMSWLKANCSGIQGYGEVAKTEEEIRALMEEVI